jgi:ABC-2 type transport system ATP-binding protein
LGEDDKEPIMRAEPLLLSAAGIVKAFGRRPVLEDACLGVRAGEAVALVGENGAGKTTLLRICAGLLPMDSGQVQVAGRIGYCPQEPGVFELLTATEHLILFGRAVGLRRQKALAHGRAILESFGFPSEERLPARDLSGGTKQKLNLALALLGDPQCCCSTSPTRGSTEGPTSTSGITWIGGARKARPS